MKWGMNAVNDLLCWISEHETEIRSVATGEELEALLRENGFSVSAEQLKELCSTAERVALEDKALENITGGISRAGMDVEIRLFVRILESIFGENEGKSPETRCSELTDLTS